MTMNPVVGSPGTTTPIPPTATASQPALNHTLRASRDLATRAPGVEAITVSVWEISRVTATTGRHVADKRSRRHGSS